MTPKMKAFLTEFADLIDRYAVSISYTVYDDGIHVYLDDEDICVGFIGENGNEIRALINERIQ